jgi:hypothetical protein
LSFTCGENKAQYLVKKTTQKTQKVEQAFQMKGMQVGEGKLITLLTNDWCIAN